MMRALGISLICAVLIACTTPQVIPVPPNLPIPETWNDLSSGTVGQSECPLVRGKYRDRPVKVSTPNSPFLTKDLKVLTFMGVLPFRLGKVEVVAQSNSKTRSEVFELYQVDADAFSIRFEDLNFEVVKYTFELDTVKYQCKNGLMYFPIIGRYGADQTGSFNSQYQEVMAIDSAGSLVLIRITGPYRKTAFSGSKEFQYDFYRYPRVE